MDIILLINSFSSDCPLTFVKMSLKLHIESYNQEVHFSFPNDIQVFMKREDLLHPLVSGNKFRKLKYNLIQAQQENHAVLLTFGGAYSNHIVATAAAAKEQGFQSIGIIRGEELESKIAENPTLSLAKSLGMQLIFVSRDLYRHKTEEFFIKDLQQRFGRFYLVPEGGTNEYAVQGCQEILTPKDASFDYICASVGTGGTIAGLIRASQSEQFVLGFSSLKTEYLQNEISKFAPCKNWGLNTDYHFGGYGKITPELIAFINDFYQKTTIPLDPVYTGKMMFGLNDLIAKKYFKKGSKILTIHTGGLQGIQGMNQFLTSKKSPNIIING